MKIDAGDDYDQLLVPSDGRREGDRRKTGGKHTGDLHRKAAGFGWLMNESVGDCQGWTRWRVEASKQRR